MKSSDPKRAIFKHVDERQHELLLDQSKQLLELAQSKQDQIELLKRDVTKLKNDLVLA
jgi:hypothetical protein